MASGKATYGYGGGGGYYAGYPGYYPWYDPWYWGWGWYGWYGSCGFWGWPYSVWPYAAYPGDVGPTYLVSSEGAEIPAAVETRVKPKRATVLLDGSPVGEARDYAGNWDLLWVPSGQHTIDLVAEGHRTLRIALDVEPGARYRIVEALAPGEGLDPRSTSHPPPQPEAAAQPEGIERAPSADRGVAPAPTMALARGRLRIAVSPPDAAVYLDGEFLARGDELGRLHGALPVAAGVHTVEAVRPGYRSRAIEVDVRGADPVRVELALEAESP